MTLEGLGARAVVLAGFVRIVTLHRLEVVDRREGEGRHAGAEVWRVVGREEGAAGEVAGREGGVGVGYERRKGIGGLVGGEGAVVGGRGGEGRCGREGQRRGGHGQGGGGRLGRSGDSGGRGRGGVGGRGGRGRQVGAGTAGGGGSGEVWGRPQRGRGWRPWCRRRRHRRDR